MRGASVMTVNDYELELVKNKTGLSESEILDEVRMLVITRGAEGATLESNTTAVDVPAVAAAGPARSNRRGRCLPLRSDDGPGQWL